MQRIHDTVIIFNKYFDNIIVTEQGIRLIDVGISAIKEIAGELLFNKYTEAEMKELEEYYDYLLSQ